jgi:hypothetical protein
MLISKLGRHVATAALLVAAGAAPFVSSTPVATSAPVLASDFQIESSPAAQASPSDFQIDGVPGPMATDDFAIE